MNRKCEGGDDEGFDHELFLPAQPQRGTEQKRVSPHPGYPFPPAQSDVQHYCRGQRWENNRVGFGACTRNVKVVGCL